MGIADLFMARFDPASPLPDAKYHAWLQTLRDEVEGGVQEDMVAKEVLLRMIQVLDATKRTNLFLEDRYALALRLSNGLFTAGKMEKPFKTGPEADVSIVPVSGTTPYGVFYVHGRRFNGFHVRFRDIARGGMRLVTPNSVEQLAIESARQCVSTQHFTHSTAHHALHDTPTPLTFDDVLSCTPSPDKKHRYITPNLIEH